MLMYKDGVTRTVASYEVERFKEAGWVEVKPKEVVVEVSEETESKPKRQRRYE